MAEDEESEDEKIERRLRELEENTTRAANEHRSAAEFDDHFEDRLKGLEERAKGARLGQQQINAQTNERRRVESETGKGLGLGLSVAYMIVGVPLFGALIGYFIDKGTNSNIFKGLCTITGAVIGITMTVITVNRHNPDR
jgi:F0F1-type ATP synthase assembly protein I